MASGLRLEARPFLGDPEPTVSTWGAKGSPDHRGALGKRGSVAANLLAIDRNTGGPWVTKDIAFSGALRANVRSGETPGPKFLDFDTDGPRLWGWCTCP